MTEWQPIETAPKDGSRVLICGSGGEIDIASYTEQWSVRDYFVRHAKDDDVYKTVKEECGYWETDVAFNPTHWMPLPRPPESLPHQEGKAA